VLRAAIFPGRRVCRGRRRTNDDATFKPASELAKIYFEQCGVTPEKDTVVYCRIGERSSHTWFVLTYLLGLNNVRTTTVRGLNGATRSERRLRRARNRTQP